MYQVAYEQWYAFEKQVIVLKPYNLTYQQLQSTPIRIVFCSTYFYGVIAEFRITRQTQIIELFKILQRLNLSGNLITNILKAILKNWEDQFKNKDLEFVTFANTPKEFYNSVLNDKQEPWPKGRIDLEF
ncbi:hypothetical protein [Mesomycoplasma ovipneumoniae]|uniref:hypothetical protein n=1 Tax=Mesomycoplasma ovipneumoniae TaxID=29562 RepID=UPI0024ADCFBC|nr:hypothetical protein [Mesomycoplasma ovipneumoniae]WHF53310.1 hypothetical protein QJQ40_02575 [Mesomycoplasma ovipneumoniae]